MSGTENGTWTLLTAHGRALVEIAANPDTRMRDLAAAIGVIERTAQSIVADLEYAGYLTRQRVGRRNRYTVNLDQPFRHRAQTGHQVGPFLHMLAALPGIARATELPSAPDADPVQPDGHGANPSGVGRGQATREGSSAATRTRRVGPQP
jgi:hypothetical protein